ncbi:kunitz/Bovine pancreatic trypsin inhibitor domain-containing protein [Loa loa]|uniref:Kunitz/Bovine pancreatic trypsin inhibitor domain-containing protein n=1 Tax=Loa loa TaxID=7209 RepID=A0A1S0U9G4_LOALO|nr:kunitz/Bovine pancreatic trypsin inhibitor domain-containing protein [Loa loa]EFO27077.1 kunitz/Bovine pancreatic trypsin inhibitor domain-containing protein [Loa loa]
MIYSPVLTLPMFLYNLLDAARSPDPPVFTDVQRYPCICYLPPDSGLCPTEETNDDTIGRSELQVRYYFDPVTEKCYPFGAQSCGGNENRFENLGKCQSVCTKHK